MTAYLDDSNELTGRVALVTGGTKGTGKAIAERLKRAGANVIITARNQPEPSNTELHFIPADLSEPEAADNVASRVLETFGQLDILVNNLGGSETPGGGFAALTNRDWEETIQTNLLAPVRLDRAFAAHDQKKKWCNCPHRVHSGKVAVIRCYVTLCRCEGWIN